MSGFQAAKWWLVAHLGLPKDALHVYVGLAVYLGAAAAMRWRLADRRPWALAVAAALVGEAWDLADELRYGNPVRAGAHWHDLWNTCLWPTAILLLARTGRLRA